MNKSLGNSETFKGMRPYGITAVLVVAAYSLASWQFQPDERVLRLAMLLGVVVAGMIGLFVLLRTKRGKTETLITVILFAGIVMRIGYMLYTNILLRGHDISGFNEHGHLDYVYQIFTTGALPTTNESQFYHPPLQHILQAIVVKIYSLIRPDRDLYSLFQAAKIVPCFAMCSLLFVCRSICRELRLNSRATALALAIIAFQPTFYLLSSSINNDALMLLFYMIAVLYTIRWYHQQSMKNILLLALAIGCGMMTKISAATVAFFTAPVFLLVLIRRIKEKRALPLVGQFAAFLGVSAPLGLWYPIRNLVKFDQPLNYVLDVNLPQLYCGDQTIFNRFLSIPIDEILNPLYCQPFGDFNLWLYNIKCSVFGEYSFDQHQPLAKLLILANLILIVLSLAAMVYVLLRGKEVHPLARFGLFWIWLLQMGFFLLFNLQYPYGCTMDFRYIVPTAIIGAIYLAIALDRIKRKKKLFSNVIWIGGVAAVVAFGIASVLFYTV